MPREINYPGVFVKETPAMPGPIEGGPTSVTAFIGRAPMGPVDACTEIDSFADFERRFSGLAADYPLTYAVRDFYDNGGATALIVRLFEPGAPAKAQLPLSTLALQAANEGAWGNGLGAQVDRNGVTLPGYFNLTVTLQTASGQVRTEVFRNVTVNVEGGQKRLDVVLQNDSDFVRLPVLPSAPPDPGASGSGSGGSDSNPLSLRTYLGDQLAKTGLYALEQVPVFNILCIPPDAPDGDTPASVYEATAAYCAERRAMLILDPPREWQDKHEQGDVAGIAISDLGSFPPDAARSAAVYFPRMLAVDPLRNGETRAFPPSGAVAGIWAATDAARGVWKAPAGLGAALNGVAGLEANLTDPENGLLNPQGINCLRSFPTGGTVVWGARTLRGADGLEDEYKYIPVQRTMLYIAGSLLANTQWAVFEPNDEPLWSQLRLSVGVFMAQLFRQGAFQGTTADQAYFVKCDATTTTQADVDAGIVNVQVGFAPLKPAEFVVITIQQIAGQA